MLDRTAPKPDGASATPDPLKNAAYATLNNRSVTDEAKRLVDQLASLVGDYERTARDGGYLRGPAGEKKLWDALEGFLGDLLLSAADEKTQGWTFRRRRRDDFTRERVSFRTFDPLREALCALGLLKHFPGYQRVSKNPFHEGPGSGYTSYESMAARYRATESLLEYARREGIEATNADQHFVPRLPQKPLIKMSASYWDLDGEKRKGQRLDYRTTDRTRELEAEVKALNAFLDKFEIVGGGFHGFVRIFNQGDEEGFDWNKGGRLYGVSDRKAHNFQRLPEDDRLRMTIGSEPVAEIDISASYLTLLHGLQGLPFSTDSDPYAVGGLDRAIVKAWLTATLGYNKHHKKWPPRIIERLLKQGFKEHETLPRIEEVRTTMEVRYPVLRDWPEQRLTWADLMFAESRAIMGTMTGLMTEGRPSLCVHDSVLVRLGDVERAKKLLSDNYHEVCGLCPRLKVSTSDQVGT